MAQTIRDVMTAHPITFPATSSLVEAARAMRDSDIGDVIVVENGRLCGVGACSHFSGHASSKARGEVAICFNRCHRPAL